jgi:predicted amidohydrolase
MGFKIATAQTTSSAEWKDNLQKAAYYVSKAGRLGAGMIVFPEYFMTCYPTAKVCYRAEAQNLRGPFVKQMQCLAKENEMWMIFGMNEDSADPARSYNTVVVLDEKGQIAGTYRKNHLFDAFSFRESEDTIPGSQMFEPLDTPAGKIGIGTCYDLRFPETARNAAVKGAEIMLYPSAWVKGEGKYMHWKTLLCARAIENAMYVIGCCHYSQRYYMGRSLGFGPSGELLLEAGEKEELQVMEIDLEKVKKVRHENPVLRNRRTDLY